MQCLQVGYKKFVQLEVSASNASSHFCPCTDEILNIYKKTSTLFQQCHWNFESLFFFSLSLIEGRFKQYCRLETLLIILKQRVITN